MSEKSKSSKNYLTNFKYTSNSTVDRYLKLIKDNWIGVQSTKKRMDTTQMITQIVLIRNRHTHNKNEGRKG